MASTELLCFGEASTRFPLLLFILLFIIYFWHTIIAQIYGIQSDIFWNVHTMYNVLRGQLPLASVNSGHQRPGQLCAHMPWSSLFPCRAERIPWSWVGLDGSTSNGFPDRKASMSHGPVLEVTFQWHPDIFSKGAACWLWLMGGILKPTTYSKDETKYMRIKYFSETEITIIIYFLTEVNRWCFKSIQD